VLIQYDPGHDLTVIVRLVEDATRVASKLPELFPPTQQGSRRLRQTEQAWHAKASGQVISLWKTSAETGLGAEAAALRLEAYGPNVIPGTPVRTAFAILMAQIRTLPNALLLGSAVLSVVTGGIADAVAVAAVVALNTAIGFATEYKAERTIRALLRISEPQAVVVRDGSPRQIPASGVVPGDLLALSSGNEVPADARLIECSGLSVDESPLTGESLPVEKSTDAIARERLPLADRTNMVFRGTAITGGSGRAIVVATGRATAIGLVQALISETSQPETPLQRKMEALGRRLSWVVLGMGGAVFVLGVLRGFSVLQTLRGAVSLAVAAVPEQLPTIVTVSLARGVQSLVKDGVLVLRLDALEALGSVDAVCFDKTGTLTLNRMSVVAIATFDRTFAVSGGAILDRSRPVALQAGSEISKLMDVCCLSSEAQVQRSGGEQRVSGSPTEAALLRMGLALGKDVATLRREAPIVHTQPRTQEHAYMATWHELPGGRKLLAVKGSPAEVLGLCRWFCAQTKVQPLTDAGRARIRDANGKLAWRGLRVLAVACVEGESVPDEPRDLVWLGLAAIADPPREGMREMLMRLHRAGIETLLLTGDQEATARAIGEELGVERVFGRVNPADKLLIVQKLQREGRVVAMTGDGTNDAPALRAADAGITLGAAGTRVAHGVADVLLLSDNIEALLPAIREGRAVYGNLRKALRFIGPTNASEVAVTLASLAAGFGLPFNPRQLLWTNLLTDVFPALALALDPPAKGLMNRPPDRRRADPQSPENLRTFARDAGVLSAASLAAYAYGLARYGAGARAGSLAFIALTAAQLLHAITAHGRNTASNPLLPASVASGFGLLALAQFAPPVTSALALERAGALDLLVCAAAALSGFAINEAFSAGAQPLTLTRKELDYAALPQS
jgi:Ca2+-transporting ATPase